MLIGTTQREGSVLSIFLVLASQQFHLKMLFNSIGAFEEQMPHRIATASRDYNSVQMFKLKDDYQII